MAAVAPKNGVCPPTACFMFVMLRGQLGLDTRQSAMLIYPQFPQVHPQGAIGAESF
jgi:hypothetical protein